MFPASASKPLIPSEAFYVTEGFFPLENLHDIAEFPSQGFFEKRGSPQTMIGGGIPEELLISKEEHKLSKK